MEMNEQMLAMLEQMELTAILMADGKTIQSDEFGAIVINAQNERINFGENGPVVGLDGEVELITVNGEVVTYAPEDEGMSLESVMAMLPMIESYLWPEQEGNPVIMAAFAGEPQAVSMVQDKLGVFAMLVDNGPDGLREKTESLAQKGVDFLGGVMSSILGNIGATADGEGEIDFPTEIDRSTGLIRIVGEIGLFLRSFDNFADSMAPNLERENNMVELFVVNLDKLMRNAIALADISFTDEEA